MYFKTAQAGARENGGLRDANQWHECARGEFGPRIGILSSFFSTAAT
jgi:hypothetical protein